MTFDPEDPAEILAVPPARPGGVQRVLPRDSLSPSVDLVGTEPKHGIRIDSDIGRPRAVTPGNHIAIRPAMPAQRQTVRPKRENGPH